MRFLYSPLLFILVGLAAGCSAPTALSTATPVPQPSVVPGGGSDMRMQADAIATGRRWLEAGGFTWENSPQPVLAEQMTYLQATQLVPAMSDPQSSGRSPDMPVWLVIFKGRWDLMPMGPPGATLQPNTYEGCRLVVFKAENGDLIASGDSVCP